MKYLACAVFVLVSLGCGDDESRPDSPDAGNVPDAGDDTWTIASFCAAHATRMCGGLETCSCRFDIRPYDADGCEAARAADCEAQFEPLAAAFAAGTLGLSPTAVTGCLDGLSALAAACAYPSGFSADLAACSNVVVATAALGETCGLDGAGPCADGAGLCVPPEGGSAGECTAVPGDGEPCVFGACGAGLVCKAAETPTCGAPGGANAACLDDRECAAGLTCRPDNTCGAPGAIDAPCFDRRDCAEGLSCPAGTCAVGTALGEACNNPDACGNTRGCGRAPETRTCGAPGALDAPCMDGTCAAGLACAQSTMTCVTLPALDAPCLDGTYCADGLTCSFATTTCIALPTQGQTCAEGLRRCAAGLGCRDSDQTCQPATIATNGQPCLHTGEDYLCADGLGCDFAPEGSICIPVGGAGDPCTNDRVCGDGTYCEFSELECTVTVAPGGHCEDGNECGDGAECAPQPDGFECTTLPGAGAPCFEGCADGLACQGAGGECTAELCTLP